MAAPAEDAPDYSSPTVYDQSVVPRYAQRFVDLLLRVVELPQRSHVVDLACRTGHLALELLERMPDGRIVALDADERYVDMLRARAARDLGRRLFPAVHGTDTLPFDDGTFSLAVCNLVDRVSTDRSALLSETARVLRPGGQIVLTQPMQGSFVEVIDLLREVALKYDMPRVAARVDEYVASLPSAAQWRDELTAFGFDWIAIEQSQFELVFSRNQSLLSDPAVVACAAPEWQWCASAANEPEQVLYRLQDAIELYFDDHDFELSVVAGCVSARRAT